MQIAQLIGQQAQKSLSQAETMRLQQLKNGMATVQQQLTSGEIFPHEAEDLVSQLSQQMVPLQQREEEAAAMAEQAQDAALAKANVNQAEGDGFRRAASAKNAGNQIAKLPNPYNGMEEFYWIPEDGSQPQPMFQGGEGAPEGGEVQAFPLAAQFAVGTNPGEGQQQTPQASPQQVQSVVESVASGIEPQRPNESGEAFDRRFEAEVERRLRLIQRYTAPQQPRPMTPYQEQQLELSRQRLQQSQQRQDSTRGNITVGLAGLGTFNRQTGQWDQPGMQQQYAGTQLDEPVGPKGQVASGRGERGDLPLSEQTGLEMFGGPVPHSSAQRPQPLPTPQQQGQGAQQGQGVQQGQRPLPQGVRFNPISQRIPQFGGQSLVGSGNPQMQAMRWLREQGLSMPHGNYRGEWTEAVSQRDDQTYTDLVRNGRYTAAANFALMARLMQQYGSEQAILNSEHGPTYQAAAQAWIAAARVGPDQDVPPVTGEDVLGNIGDERNVPPSRPAPNINVH